MHNLKRTNYNSIIFSLSIAIAMLIGVFIGIFFIENKSNEPIVESNDSNKVNEEVSVLKDDINISDVNKNQKNNSDKEISTSIVYKDEGLFTPYWHCPPTAESAKFTETKEYARIDFYCSPGGNEELAIFEKNPRGLLLNYYVNNQATLSYVHRDGTGGVLLTLSQDNPFVLQGYDGDENAQPVTVDGFYLNDTFVSINPVLYIEDGFYPLFNFELNEDYSGGVITLDDREFDINFVSNKIIEIK